VTSTQATPLDGSQAPDETLRDLLGYLNFSQGAPSPRFRACLNELFAPKRKPQNPTQLRQILLNSLDQLRAAGEPVFTESAQATEIILFTLDQFLPAYRSHHSDLLAHVPEHEFFSPFLLAKMFEAALSTRAELGCLNNHPNAIPNTLPKLNLYVGYRPIPVLENGRRSEVYAHERFCPLPLYISDVGVAHGPWQPLITATVRFLSELPQELLHGSHFSFDRLHELCLDLRAHDHAHPVTKRTNYVFGEWDPDEIDTKGFFRRFMVRRLILDALQSWVERNKDPDDPHYVLDPERLYDASVVLAGTILMASAISGSGPGTWDSSVSLTTLLPIVARQRDQFYQRLLEIAQGERGRRLKKLARETRQPFGHVRHDLNMFLSKYGADQIQHRHLSWMFARMGYEQASREEASFIPCLSARFESEIQARLVMLNRFVRKGELDQARRLIAEVIELWNRGIQCGGLADPWCILGFQGLFPLFTTREDSIPDNRIEVLLELIGQFFDACTLTMSESAASGRPDLHDAVLHDFRRVAEEWDAYATTTVHDLTPVEGTRSVEAAVGVAKVLALWREAGESAGDISFWRQHVQDFSSTGSFAQVVAALLERRDHVAAMGLLMQWLSCADSVPLENGPHSIHRLLHRLVVGLCDHKDSEHSWNSLRRLFAFMEANAGDFWEVPKLSEFLAQQKQKRSRPGDEIDLEHLFDDKDEDDDVLSAAWDDVTYRDSTDDGNAADTMDGASTPGTTEFEILYRQIEPRLKFLHTVGSLWGIAAVWVSRAQTLSHTNPSRQDTLREWLAAIRGRLQGLGELVTEVRDYEITVNTSGLDANIEYDIQMQCRFLLMQNALSTTVEFLMAERLIGAVLAEEPDAKSDSESLDRHVSRMFTAIFSGDTAKATACFPALLRDLRKRPLLYVPFENGGQPAAILKARTLQSIIRVLLSQLPRLGLLAETYELLITAYHMERSIRPPGQAVTEFDRLYRIGLTNTIEAVIEASARLKVSGQQRTSSIVKRVSKVLDAYSDLWIRHSSSMRLSVVEDLHEDDFAEDVREFIETYGDDLFHTRMLTLGNARAILHHGAESLLKELEETVALTENVKVLDDIHAGIMDRDDVVEISEFVFECVVDNFDRFLEYNTTTTYSDYGSRLFCLLDFLRIESLYDRFEWNTVPWQIVHEVLLKRNEQAVANEVQDQLHHESHLVAEEFVNELTSLEEKYGVRLPGLHDHVHERVIGPFAQNHMAALIPKAVPGVAGLAPEDAAKGFLELRHNIASFMDSRIGSGLEPPEWMQRLAGELDRLQEGKLGGLSDTLMDGPFTRMTQKHIDEHLTRINRLKTAQNRSERN
jgi:hypothetical protein